MSQSVKDVLVAARAKVARGWTQYESALDHDGRACDPRDPRAARWCTEGALEAVIVDSGWCYHPAAKLLKKLIGPQHHECLFLWHDVEGRTQAEVLDLFDRAIAAVSP